MAKLYDRVKIVVLYERPTHKHAEVLDVKFSWTKSIASQWSGMTRR
jgi:hypothetical protein